MIDLFLVLAGFYLVLCVAVFLLQGRLLYFPSRDVGQMPSDARLDFEDLTLETSDGEKISAWYVPAREPRGTVLFCHGNAGNITHRIATLLLLNDLRLNVLIFDYRGYGESSGRPTEKGTYLDARAAWDYLVEKRGAKPKEIVPFGRSLGGAVAAHLAAEVEPRALILESTFTSIPDMGARTYPFLPVRLLCRFDYDTREILPNVRCPVLIVHSPNDEIIPYNHGRALYDAANEPKTFLELRGSHNEGFLDTGNEYNEGIDGFLKKVFDEPTPRAGV
ncbi:alpha/beta hydrolase [Candidatus Sumerlaeota bacterium]|nr:alpha/beta hydrolase [Candidatus Sumerlaeota bacterium]